MHRSYNDSVLFLSSKRLRRRFLLYLSCSLLSLVSFAQRQKEPAQSNQIVTEFNKRVQQYVKLREQVESKLTKPSGKSEPEQIKAYQISLEEGIRNARSGAKHEDLVPPELATYIRQIIKQEFKGARLKKLRKDVATANTKGVPLRINYPYPEQKELDEMPPTLLLKLPLLPKQLRYSFVGENMLLVDREALLIIDYITNAIP